MNILRLTHTFSGEVTAIFIFASLLNGGQLLLTLKGPITTAADDIHEHFSIVRPRATRGVEIDGCFALVAGG